MLPQDQSAGPTKLVESWSQSQNKPRQTCDNTHRKFLDVICPVIISRLYLEGSPFTVLIDHNAFWCSPNRAMPILNFADWRLGFFEMECVVVHLNGRETKASHALSQITTMRTDGRPLNDVVSVLTIPKSTMSDYTTSILKITEAR